MVKEYSPLPPELSEAIQRVTSFIYTGDRTQLDAAIAEVYRICQAIHHTQAAVQEEIALAVCRYILDVHLQRLRTRNSHRPQPYELAGVAFTSDGRMWYGYNDKPESTGPFDYRYYRRCAEMAILRRADDLGAPMQFTKFVLMGGHHDNGDKEPPWTCQACLRWFTRLDGHRDIPFMLVSRHHPELVRRISLGELIDTTPASAGAGAGCGL